MIFRFWFFFNIFSIFSDWFFRLILVCAISLIIFVNIYFNSSIFNQRVFYFKLLLFFVSCVSRRKFLFFFYYHHNLNLFTIWICSLWSQRPRSQTKFLLQDTMSKGVFFRTLHCIACCINITIYLYSFLRF